MNHATGITTEGVEMQGLTARQKEVLAFIATFIRTKGYSPSYQEIGDHFGMGKSAALNHVRAIERKGYIQRAPQVARSISLVDRSAQAGQREQCKA